MDAVVDGGIDIHADVVPSDYALVRNVERDGPKVDLDELVSKGHNQEQTRPLGADESTESEYDASFVFAYDFNR